MAKTRTDGEQRDAEAKVKKIRDQYKTFYDATTDFRVKVKECFDMTRGGRHQWIQEDVAKMEREKRPVQSFNVVAPVVNFLAGYQLERDTDYRLFPRGSEDEQLGRILTGGMKYAYDQAGGKDQSHLQFRKGATCGLSVLEVGHSFDYTDDLLEGDCTLTVLPENAWYYEIGARRYDRNDAQYQGKLMWFTVDEAKERWPQHAHIFKGETNRDLLLQDPMLSGVSDELLQQFYDVEGGRVRILQHWYRVPVKVTLIVNLATGEVQRMKDGKEAENFIRQTYDTAGRQAAANFEIEEAESQTALINQATGVIHPFRSPDEAVRALDNVKRQAGTEAANQFDMITRPTTALRMAHLTGTELLDDQPASTGSDWRYPFSPFVCYQDTDDLLAIKGVVTDIIDPQREVNWHHATMLDNLVRGPKSGVWLNKAEKADVQRVKREFSRAGFVGEYAGNDPIPVTPAMISPDDMRMLEFGIEIIMRITGINAEMLGQTTQKTVSGRAIQSRQAGGLVGVGTIFANWARTRRYTGELLLRRIQQYYSPEKFDRIIGLGQRMAQQSGMLGQIVIPDVMMFEQFKRAKMIDADLIVDFQESSPSARNAVATQMMQFKAAGAPIPLELIIEASDMPYKQEMLAAVKMMGEQPPNPELAKTVGAGQGQTPQPNGVNAT